MFCTTTRLQCDILLFKPATLPHPFDIWVMGVRSTVHLSGVAAAASAAGGPELPGLATPVVHIDGAVKVGVAVTRGTATAA